MEIPEAIELLKKYPPGTGIHCQAEYERFSDAREMIAYLNVRELDQTPLDVDFAKRVAVDEPAVNVFSVHNFGNQHHYFHIWFADDESIELAMCGPSGHASYISPTVGQFWTTCRLFGVTPTLKESHDRPRDPEQSATD